MRVVLYAEGGGETAGPGSYVPSPGDLLTPDDMLGPAHFLIRRCIRAKKSIPENAIHFESPLRTRGNVAKGSHLLDRSTLRQLLTWFRPEMRPDLAIVLVDRDGVARRKTRLVSHIRDLDISAPRLIAVAREEFEAWLLADHSAVQSVLGSSRNQGPYLERMEPGEAKGLLQRWFGECIPENDHRLARREIAQSCDLTTVQRRCPSFRAFLTDLDSPLQ